MRLKPIGTLATAAILTAALSTVTTTQTSAAAGFHDSSRAVWTGIPPALVGRAQGGVKSNHTRIWICDRVDDEMGARTRYWTTNGGYDIVGDADGGGGNCGEESSYNGQPVTHYQVCVGRNGANTHCSDRVAA
ncbi:hypothetical protein SAMN05444920_117186 [Nonomuraea solani]|uniref:Secreted protein n=1 Tax=Nonomuraea solani TaxID=1144553 RepID=A0A1H6EUZ6_9ACTN|nr:hypothetical protein [Nonomuraea solani]SEH00755.1 hypothetical protein SAMN05444920_117186 [Nonomuraea solani]